MFFAQRLVFFGRIANALLRFTQLLKGRKWISASVITLIMFLLIIVPATMLTLATVDEFKTMKELHNEGLLIIPPPDENIKSWPVIGPTLFDQWTEISANILEFYKNMLKLLILLV